MKTEEYFNEGTPFESMKPALSKDAVGGSTFTNDELKTIKIDMLHIYEKVDLNELEVHKRDLILNKLKVLLGEDLNH
jgi:DNA polymerase sigma